MLRKHLLRLNNCALSLATPRQNRTAKFCSTWSALESAAAISTTTKTVDLKPHTHRRCHANFICLSCGSAAILGLPCLQCSNLFISSCLELSSFAPCCNTFMSAPSSSNFPLPPPTYHNACACTIAGGIGSDHISEPFVPGHEVAARTINAIPELGIAANELVGIDPALPCDQCEHCQRGHRNLCTQLKFLGKSSK